MGSSSIFRRGLDKECVEYYDERLLHIARKINVGLDVVERCCPFDGSLLDMTSREVLYVLFPILRRAFFK